MSNKEYQLEDDKCVIENSYYSLQEALDRALKLKKHSHRNRPLKIYDVTDNAYILVKSL